MIDKLKSLMSNNRFDSNLIYLLYPITDKTGFFCYDNKIICMVYNEQNIPHKSFDTTTLSLRCNMRVTNIEDNNSFREGNYNFIMYNSDVNSDEFEVFVSLCELYCKNIPTIKFDDFFFQLSKLFQIPREESYNNLIGFYGELLFIWEMFDKYGLCLADYWHVNGSMDIYDFTFKNNFNIEIKTTVKDDNIFKIKHKQLFNSDVNYIIVNNIQENPSGFSIQNLIELLNDNEVFASNLNFQMKVEEEKKKCTLRQLTDVVFSKTKSSVYLNLELETLIDIPQCINELSYNYTFDDEKKIDIEKLSSKIQQTI